LVPRFLAVSSGFMQVPAIRAGFMTRSESEKARVRAFLRDQ
jgi:hypothetical protein